MINSILLKGTSEYSVVKMLVRFRENKYGVSADIQKFYNTLKLDQSHYKYRMAMWRPNMIPEEEAEELVLPFLWYLVSRWIMHGSSEKADRVCQRKRVA